jgi:hypothetical protein
MRNQLSRLDADLEERRSEFTATMARATSIVLSRAAALSEAFGKYASAFLVEQNELTWAPVSERVGQLGTPVSFPNFALMMGGSDFAGSTTRVAPGSVSESQKEFIDLAFRMALVEIGSTGAEGTLLVDSPDYSLDGVFEPKAAHALSEFLRNGPNSRLVVTSNLTSGAFVPTLVADARRATGGEPGVLDLLGIAVPTAAVRENWEAYKGVRDSVFERSGLEVSGSG